MPAGMRFKNNSGSITIDGLYRNMDLLSIDDAPSGWYIRWYPPSPAVFCLYSETGYTIAYAYEQSGATAAWQQGAPVFTTVGTAKRIYFADKEIQRATRGINLRNPNTGQLIFSSKCKPMRVVDAIAGTHNMNDDSIIYERQFDPSRKYAVAMGNIPCRVDARGSWSPSIGTRIICVNGKVTISAGVIGGKTSGGVRGNIATPVYNFLIVDVTGYV